jgi:hypothetical protein
MDRWGVAVRRESAGRRIVSFCAVKNREEYSFSRAAKSLRGFSLGCISPGKNSLNLLIGQPFCFHRCTRIAYLFIGK